MRGATASSVASADIMTYFNPRSSCEERPLTMFVTLIPYTISIHAPHARSDDRQVTDFLIRVISIHAPHARSDLICVFFSSILPYFNPRSSCEERRNQPKDQDLYQQFQSTLLMRGATHTSSRPDASAGYFNPRSSCEERPSACL